MYATDSTSKKPSNRLSAMFSRQKSVDGGRPSLSPTTYPNANGNNSVDSAYASSDPSASNVSTHTSPESRHANMVSIENNGQISGVDGSRHLQLNQKTGEVLDEDTGEVVTTVTTTTTTTTTVVKKAGGGKGGAEVRVETQPGHPGTTQTSTQQRVGGGGGGGGQQAGHIAEAPGDGPSARLTQPDHPPTFTSSSTARERSPVPAPLQIGRQPPPHVETGNTNNNPALPQRNPNRSSRDFMTSPPSPITPGGAGGRHNFSYPARVGTKSTEHLPQHMVSQETMHQQYSPPHAPPPQQQNSGREGYSFSTGPPSQPQSKEAHSFSTGIPLPLHQTPSQPQPPPTSRTSAGGALENLKAAAIGLHGVGETLRGTLNSEVDNRLSRRNPDKAAQVNAKNRADIERGQAEMARLRERNGLSPTIRRPGQEGDGGALGQSLSGPGGMGAEGRVSERAPQIPPMNHGSGNGVNSSITTATGMGLVGAQGQGQGGAGQSGNGMASTGIGQGVQPSKWDAPGTWGSGSVSANTGAQQQQGQSINKPQPQVRTAEVHPALRGQGQPTQAQGQGVEGQRYGGTPAAAVGAQRPTEGVGQGYPGAPSTGPGPGSTPANYGPGTSGLGNAGGRGKPIPLNEPGMVGGNGSAAANVQHLSQQGNSHEAEEEGRRKGTGLGRLFKRKGVGA
ncbi:hypothetical protein LTR10_015010 [Elasticomyces elasticus]|nr:hypothetical protein LTR10_015010 [Elasticomyces elasticus]KAK4964586.1 hypothetical protein LTR42_012884 [Elasticomyces elasticus]